MQQRPGPTYQRMINRSAAALLAHALQPMSANVSMRDLRHESMLVLAQLQNAWYRAVVQGSDSVIDHRTVSRYYIVRHDSAQSARRG